MIQLQTIQIIDPLNLTVTANITTDQYGLPLTNQAGGKNVSKLWNDAVFVQARLSKILKSDTLQPDA